MLRVPSATRWCRRSMGQLLLCAVGVIGVFQNDSLNFVKKEGLCVLS
jgi:hypothetical protein